MHYHVYILASRSGALYVGVTNNLMRRLFEHRNTVVTSRTTRYRIHRLVHYETTEDIYAAIAREKQIKAWRREKKVALIRSANPAWDDLAVGWFKQIPRYARNDSARAAER
ncbi:MAG TPA: GIY-YIG nuclease family protein [Xanthomonadaceae bacterium]|nr:GIY-YIG nuclease family protein [Xanthomonadaceae bacterium]